MDRWGGTLNLRRELSAIGIIRELHLRFDLEIMWLTIWRGLVNKHAY